MEANSAAPRAKGSTGISLMNILLCLGVVFIHVCSEFILEGDPQRWTYTLVAGVHRLASFVMQGFVFLSAVKLMGKYRDRPFHYGRFVLDRVRRIYIPYLIWTVLYYLYFVYYREWFSPSGTELIRYLLTGSVTSPFYFIIVIMQCYLLMPLWLRMVKSLDAAVALPLAVLLTLTLGSGFEFAYSDRTLLPYLIFWVAGCYIGWYGKQAAASLRGSRGLLYAVLLLSAAGEVYFSLWGSMNARGSLHLLYCLTAVLALYTATLPARGERLDRVVRRTDRLTFGVFLIHCLVMNWVNYQLDLAGISRLAARLGVRFVAVYGCSFLLVVLYRVLRDRLRGGLPGRA